MTINIFLFILAGMICVGAVCRIFERISDIHSTFLFYMLPKTKLRVRVLSTIEITFWLLFLSGCMSFLMFGRL